MVLNQVPPPHYSPDHHPHQGRGRKRAAEDAWGSSSTSLGGSGKRSAPEPSRVRSSHPREEPGGKDSSRGTSSNAGRSARASPREVWHGQVCKVYASYTRLFRSGSPWVASSKQPPNIEDQQDFQCILSAASPEGEYLEGLSRSQGLILVIPAWVIWNAGPFACPSLFHCPAHQGRSPSPHLDAHPYPVSPPGLLVASLLSLTGSCASRRLASRLVPKFVPRFPSLLDASATALITLHQGRWHPEVLPASQQQQQQQEEQQEAIIRATREDALQGLGELLHTSLKLVDKAVPTVMRIVDYLFRCEPIHPRMVASEEAPGATLDTSCLQVVTGEGRASQPETSPCHVWTMCAHAGSSIPAPLQQHPKLLRANCSPPSTAMSRQTPPPSRSSSPLSPPTAACWPSYKRCSSWPSSSTLVWS